MKNVSFIKLNIIAALLVLCGSVFAAQVENPYTTYSRYNPIGQLTGTIASKPSASLGYPAVRYTYNDRGLQEKIENGSLNSWHDETQDPAAWVGFTVYSSKIIAYDDFGRKSVETAFDKNNIKLTVVEYKYDDHSRVWCKAKRMNLIATGDACTTSNSTGANPDRLTRYTYENSYNQITLEERGVGTGLAQIYVTNEYNINILKAQMDANGNRTELYYDEYMRTKRVIYPHPTTIGQANGTETGTTGDYVEYRYDINGNKTYERKRSGAVINYIYDNNNRMTRKDMANNTKDVCYGYDLRGLAVYSRFGTDPLNCSGQGITNNFDGFGTLANTNNNMTGVSRTLTYAYDLNGNRKYIKHPDAQHFSYTYDGLNRVAGVSDSVTPNNNLLTVSYQANGRRNKISRTGGAETAYAFPNGVQLQNFSQAFATTTNNLTNSFLYNAAGQVTSLTESNSQYSYIGNNDRVGVYKPNGLNQYTTIANQPMVHDLNGNMTNDGSAVYTYDDENRLLTATGSGLTASLLYDPNGRLFQTTINGTTRQYLYDGDALVAEYVGGVLQRRYVHGDQVDEPWVQYNSSSIAISGRRYLHANHQGSIIAHSNSAGSVVNTLAYDAYGIPASLNVDSFAYTGQIWLKELNLYYYKARIYSPKIGRFLQTDPIGYADNMNMYAYVGNDPVNLNDSTGMWANFAAGALAGMVVELAVQVIEGNGIDAGAVVMAGVAGAVSSGASAVAAVAARQVATKGAQIAIKAVGEVTASATESAVNGEDITVTGVAADLVGGKVAGDLAPKTNINANSAAASHKGQANGRANARSEIKAGQKLDAGDTKAVKELSSGVGGNAAQAAAGNSCQKGSSSTGC